MKRKMVVAMVACMFGTCLMGCPTVAAEERAEPCTLSFLAWYPQEKYQPILDAFEKEYPDIKIEFQYAAPVADYLEKMQVLTSTGEMPDLFYISAENKTEMMENGYCEDITDLEAVSKLVDANRSCYEMDGKVYGFSPTTWVGGYFYNKDLFAQYNLEVPETWDEFVNVCKTLQDNGVRSIIERGEWFWDSFLGPFMNDYLPDDDATLVWCYERMNVTVDKDGIISMNWEYPADIKESVSDNVGIISFDEAKKTFEKMMPVIYEGKISEWNDENNTMTIDVDVNQVSISLMRVRDSGSERKGVYSPAWIFYGKVIEHHKSYNEYTGIQWICRNSSHG